VSEDKGLERVNYYYGQVLSADDFEAEQNYFLGKLRRHNRYLHGWGIVSGFSVSVSKQSATVVVEPGIAIDCFGNEVVLDRETECAMPKHTGKLYVVIEYVESKNSPAPIVCDSPSGGEQKLAYSRIQERCLVDIIDVDTASGHKGIGPGTPGCGHPHPITIASLLRGPKGWRAAPRGRRRA